MKRLLFAFFCAVLMFVGVQGQEFTGVHSSPYLPFVGVINQPAELTRDNAKWNINMLAINATFLNNQSFVSSNFFDAMAKFGYNDLKYWLGSEESLVYLNGRIMAPSITYKLNDKHSFGLTAGIRAEGIYNSSNDDFLKLFNGGSTTDDLKDEHFNSLVNSWVEYGVIWSSTLLKTENHWLTGGVVLKVLNGSGSGYLDMDGIDIKYNDEGIEHFNMKFSYGFNESLGKTIDGGDIIERSGDMGIGLDLGLSYSHLPDHLMGVKGVPYKVKYGFVVSDIGNITHSETQNQASYQVQMNDVPYSRFNGITTLEALKDSIEKSVDFVKNEKGSFKTKLPISIAGNIDYCVRPNWFINSTFVYKTKYYRDRMDVLKDDFWKANVTGRYETRKLGVYLPVSYSSILGWSMGISGRYRNFFIGSSTILSNLMERGTGHGLLYFGISIPISPLPNQ